MRFESVNPATGEALETFEAFSPSQINAALDQARSAFGDWKRRSFAERSDALRRVAAYLRAHKTPLARFATLEMGKPIAEAEAEIEKCAWNCEFYAERAEAMLADEPVATSATESYISYLPLGPVLAVMPWNYPFWQVLRFAAPALMAGNVALLKHASNVSRCALEIERVFRECGLPEGVFQTLLVPGSEVDRIIADRRIAAVTLTGSDPAGQAVGAAAGRALKTSVLELGGSDAFIVLEDADLDAAAKIGVRARFQNTGQSCIAAKRFIIEESVADAFEQKFAEQASKLRMGDPLDGQTQLGPVARADLRDALADQLDRSVAMGAKVVLGGKVENGAGAFYPATIVTGVTTDMPIFSEETFGPVAAVIRARDAEHAVELANDSEFGLGGNLWTRDLDRARQLARRLESGAVFINGMTASDPRLPFGGVKQSGYGRELSSYGIREFVNIQTVWIGPASTTNTPPVSIATE